MDNRDKNFENNIKNEYINIPESLKPENIEQKLFNMSPEEMNRRSESNDVPYQEIDFAKRSGEKTSADKKKSMGKVVLPIVIAASLIVGLGLGLFLGTRRRSGETAKGEAESFNESDEVIIDEAADEAAAETAESEKDTAKEKTSKKKDKDDNYNKAYDRLKAYYDESQNAIDYTYGVDIVEEAADEAVESEVAENDSVQTLSPRKSKDSVDSSDVNKGQDDGSVDFTDTNVRTEGVAEGDIIKTDGKYIYAYDRYTLHIIIYRVQDGKIEKCGGINVLNDDMDAVEMYINGDRLIFIGRTEDSGYMDKTGIVIYDISDRENPEMVKSITQDGMYYSSRMVGDKLYTFSKKSVDLGKMRKKKYKTYIPEIDGDIIENDKILVQDDIHCDTYVVVSAVDLNKGKVVDRLGALAGNGFIYVSSENIYLTDVVFSWEDYSWSNETKIIKISYKDGNLSYEAKGKFPGYLKDDYCIDEHNGYIRLVTNYTDDYSTYNALYVLNKDLEKVSAIKRLAENETIKSARFMGDWGYFVTFRNTDPLFAVDLSDPENPEITDYLKIPGFSEYLHPYGDGKLLGIGHDADLETGRAEGLKLSMFDISDPSDIKEEDKVIMDEYVNANIFEDRRAFMFDSKEGRFGFATQRAWDYTDDNDSRIFYDVFDYDEEDGFDCKLEYKLAIDEYYSYDSTTFSGTRGIIIGDYLYVVVGGQGVVSFDTNKYEQVDECR